MRLEEVRVKDLLDIARASMKPEPGISLKISSDEDLPNLLVDRLQIEVVLRNLMANAVEAVAAGAAKGEISLRAQRDDAQRLLIVIADSGPGIAVSEKERVFEPFFSGKPSGMGLGLAVSRAIAEAHGGSLNSRPGPHGEFHLILPFASRV